MKPLRNVYVLAIIIVIAVYFVRASMGENWAEGGGVPILGKCDLKRSGTEKRLEEAEMETVSTNTAAL